MALTVVKGLAKVGVLGGALYVTYDQGVWSTSSQGSKALTKVRTDVLPAADEYFNKKVPSVTEVITAAVDTWNSGVQKTFTGIASAPETVGVYTRRAVDQVKGSLKP